MPRFRNPVVSTANIIDGSITSSKLADDAVTTAKLADLAVEAAKLADSSVTATKIANLAVGNAAIANAAITNAKIADLSVSNAKIVNGTIQDAKINDLSADKLTAGTIDAGVISVINLNADNITAGAITARTYRTASSGTRIEINPSSFGLTDIRWFRGSTQVGTITDTSSNEFVVRATADALILQASVGRIDLSSPSIINMLPGSYVRVGSFTAGNPQLQPTAGSVSNPAYGFHGGTGDDMGMFRAGTDALGWATNGTRRMQIDNTSVLLDTPQTTTNSGLPGWRHTGSGSPYSLRPLVSSARFKKHIGEADTADLIERLDRLPIKRWKERAALGPDRAREWISGVLAEDAAPVFPEAVGFDDEGPFAFDPATALAVPLLAAVQDLRRRVAALEAA